MADPPAPGPADGLPFRLMADSSPAQLWMTDAADRVTFVNAAHRAFFGEGEEPGGPWRRMLHPEDRDAFLAAFTEAFAARRPVQRTVRVEHPALGTRWLTCSGQPVHDAAGTFLGYSGVNIDVTDATRTEAALREAEDRSRTLLDGAPFAVIVIDPATHAILDVNERACADYGYTREDFLRLTIGDIDALGDPAAIRQRGRAHAVRPGVQEFEARHRTRSGALRDVLVRVQGVRLGGRDVTFGAHMDITDRKQAEERQALLARELDHRAKNLLAVVQSAVRLTPADALPAFRRALEGRIAALARAHTLLAESRWQGAELRALVAGELAPFLADQRVELRGEALTVPPGAAQPLAMAIHELGTNAVKHGALSVPEGRVSIGWERAEGGRRLRLAWVERGGPPVAGPPGRRGFGSRVLDATLRAQLGGTVALDWNPAGLACRIALPLSPADPRSTPPG
jgi:PAS domain S-box-containing protein